MGNVSINTVSTSAKEPRSKSVQQVTYRQSLRSAVPDSAVLSPVARPDRGGSKGEKRLVYTNHFRVDIGDAVVYQYDIDIVMIDRNHRARLARKDDCGQVIQSIVKERADFPTVW